MSEKEPGSPPPPYVTAGYPQQQQMYTSAIPPFPVSGANPDTGQYPPAGQYPPPPVTTTTVITTTPATFAPRFGEHPAHMKCPYCHEDIVTNTVYVNGALAWIICASLAFAGVFLLIPWFFCCVPFCISGCQDVEHTCPRCNRMLGTYRRIQ